jgi:hypothetical protein
MVQRMRGTERNYTLITNCVHSLVEEWNRLGCELNTGLDLRVKKPGKEE